jgi:DNA repair exonuclease SbcCD nuclease subunit
MSRPIAVLISDVHYNLQTLEVADKAMKQAINDANERNIPLIVCGDLHDTKAVLRGECVNRLIETFMHCRVPCYILRGNHDSLNEKSKENALDFLSRSGSYEEEYESYGPVCVENFPNYHNMLRAFNGNSIWLVPYHSDLNELQDTLKKIDKNSLVIMHQGLKESDSGEYIQDKTAIPAEWVQDFRVVSGHYHTRQDIKIGRPRKGAVGLWSYVGNPYTLNFAEANDPEKGYQILYDTGLLEFVPTNLRKHIVINMNGTENAPLAYNEGDLLWVKLTIPQEDTHKYTKKRVGEILNFKGDFKLDIIPTGGVKYESTVTYKSQPDVFDSIINQSVKDDERRDRLKKMWKELI